jgi:hypothetical protein
MPLYDFKCTSCDKIVENELLRISHTDDQLPTCCNQTMGYYITQPPLIVWTDPNIEPFRSHATSDRPVITTSKERREYMARNELVDANESGPPPTKAEEKAVRDEIQESIDSITPNGEIEKDMRNQGLLDIVQ